MSMKISLINHRALKKAVPRFCRRLSRHRLPQIDSSTRVLHQSTNRFLRTAITWDHLSTGGVGWVDEIDYCYRLARNEWFARYEVRDPRCLSHCGGNLCSDSYSCTDSFRVMVPHRSGQMRSRWKTDYGAKKTLFRISNDLTYSRCIGMKRAEDGYLTACLSSKNEARVKVQFGFELVHPYNDDRSERTGKGNGFRRVFEAEWCFVRISS